jgi:hypothetical protein
VSLAETLVNAELAALNFPGLAGLASLVVRACDLSKTPGSQGPVRLLRGEVPHSPSVTSIKFGPRQPTLAAMLYASIDRPSNG